ncbi:hypothetical protein GGR50DRAFT_30489 [Xylaria sp. CBS 124048]|nr:hypothetical protein GGR50DRAFT_30489 [Xylaria sp. CBS 124048]
MKSSILGSLVLAKGALAVRQSICPFNYPIELKNTHSNNGLVFTIASTNPVTNNRAIQLRSNPDLDSGSFAGLDATSPVLLSNFQDGAFKSLERNQVNQLEDLGATGYLNQRDEIESTHRYTVGFANATEWPGDVDRAWYLSGGSPDATYDLYHQEPIQVVNGFILCTADHDLDSGPWYQLFYYTYQQSPANFPECEFVGIRTTVAATILNGQCDIGGTVAL